MAKAVRVEKYLLNLLECINKVALKTLRNIKRNLMRLLH